MEKQQNPILFDGAMGTYIAQKFQTDIKYCEMENLDHPNRVLDIHREYSLAGADAIKTNTFAANTSSLPISGAKVEEIIDAACAIAKEAVEGTPVKVFASIGPIQREDAAEEYRSLIRRFIKNGVLNFLFETYSDAETLVFLAECVRQETKQGLVICSASVGPDGYSAQGVSAQTLVDTLYASKAMDAYGFNCGSGPMHMLRLVRETNFYDRTVCIMPNAGYPTIVNGRTVFDSSPEYFAQQMEQIAKQGVNILGGCCGTTPQHIKALNNSLKKERTQVQNEKGIYVKQKMPEKASQAVRKPRIAVELDSPFGVELEPFVEGAKKLQKAGADLITIADCPIGRARADSSMFAALLKQQYGIAALPHLTCRDRNLNATKALLLALNMQEVCDVLVVTGDPIPVQDRSEIKSTFHFNSVRLAAYISQLNETIFTKNPFTVRAALNINATNFEAELKKAQKKEAAGVASFLTQPIMGDRAAKNLEYAKQVLKADLFAGIMPVISYKNACFINNEIAGIEIEQPMLDAYKDASKESAAKMAVEYSIQTIEQIKNVADGFYLITPLGRVDIICEILKEMKE